MAVRIRLKKLGRRHRPYFRVCAMDQRSPRDGKVLEELGTYDPMVADVDARAVLNGERISYWLGVGAQPSDKVKTLIKKYGAEGTHLEQQKAALEQMAQPKTIPDPGRPASLPKKQEEAVAPPAAEAPVAEAAAETPTAAETPATAEAPATEEESATEEAPATEEAQDTEEEPVEAILVDEAPAEVAATEASDEEAAKSKEEPPSE